MLINDEKLHAVETAEQELLQQLSEQELLLEPWLLIQYYFSMPLENPGYNNFLLCSRRQTCFQLDL